MWLEQWNALLALFTGEKKCLTGYQLLSHKMNIKVNGPIISAFDIRRPAMEYTLNHARLSKVDLQTAKAQPWFDAYFDEASIAKQLKKQNNNNDDIAKAKVFFNMK